MTKYMRHLVFIDESGDHNLKNGGDPNYPVFVLVAVIIDESTYREVIPKFSEFKKRYFGHDNVILHAYDIRKAKGEFKILRDPSTGKQFYADINELLANTNFKLVASVIDKRSLIQKYKYPESPYDLALEFVLERVHMELEPRKELQIILESRGKREDRKLKEVFHNICSGNNFTRRQWPFLTPVFRTKQDNDLGLQIADLVASPIGRWYLNPNQQNRAYEIIEKKFIRSLWGKIEGFGLKIFPKANNNHRRR